MESLCQKIENEVFVIGFIITSEGSQTLTQVIKNRPAAAMLLQQREAMNGKCFLFIGDFSMPALN